MPQVAERQGRKPGLYAHSVPGHVDCVGAQRKHALGMQARHACEHLHGATAQRDFGKPTLGPNRGLAPLKVDFVPAQLQQRALAHGRAHRQFDQRPDLRVVALGECLHQALDFRAADGDKAFVAGAQFHADAWVLKQGPFPGGDGDVEAALEQSDFFLHRALGEPIGEHGGLELLHVGCGDAAAQCGAQGVNLRVGAGGLGEPGVEVALPARGHDFVRRLQAQRASTLRVAFHRQGRVAGGGDVVVDAVDFCLKAVLDQGLELGVLHQQGAQGHPGWSAECRLRGGVDPGLLTAEPGPGLLLVLELLARRAPIGQVDLGMPAGAAFDLKGFHRAPP